MDALGQEPREDPTLRRLVSAVRDWRAAADDAARAAALRRYNEAAATLIGLGITLFDLDPMDLLPDSLLPLVWQEEYAEAFADAVARGHGVAAD